MVQKVIQHCFLTKHRNSRAHCFSVLKEYSNPFHTIEASTNNILLQSAIVTKIFVPPGEDALETIPPIWNRSPSLILWTKVHSHNQSKVTPWKKCSDKQNISSGTSFPHQTKYCYETLYIMHSNLMQKFKNVNPSNFSCTRKQTWGMPLSSWQLKMICV